MGKPKKKAFLIGELPAWETEEASTHGGRHYVYYQSATADREYIYHIGTTKRRYEPGAVVIAECKPFPYAKKCAPKSPDRWKYWQIV